MERLIFQILIFGWLLDTSTCNLQESITSSMILNENSLIVIEEEAPSDKEDRGLKLNAEALRGLMNFLFSISPSHVFFLVHDGTYDGLSDILTDYSKSSTSYAVMEYKQDPKPIMDSFSSVLYSSPFSRRHVLVACSVNNLINIIEMIYLNNLESPSLWWIVLVASEEALDILHFLLREGAQVIIIRVVEEDSARLYSTRPDVDGMVKFLDFGMWSSKTSYRNDLSSEIFVDLQDLYSDFGGRELIVAAKSVLPFILMEEAAEGGLLLQAGFEGSVIKGLSGKLNFTYQMMLPPDGQWGGPLPNGSVIGLIGLIYRREADFAMTSITITSSRERIIDFTCPYHIDSLTLVSQTPKKKISAFAAFSPFNFEVWLLVVLATLIMSPILVFQTTMTRNVYATNDPEDKYSLSNVFFNVYRCLVKQENLLDMTHWSMKITFVIWYIFALIVSVLYSGMLITTIVIPAFDKPIDSLTDLPHAVANGFTLQVTAETSSEYLFKDAREGIYAETWKLFNHEDRSKSFLPHDKLSYDAILREKLVVVEAATKGKFRSMKRGNHLYYFARDTYSPQNYGIACFPGAPFLETFNKMLSYMFQCGLISKYLDDEFRRVEVDSTIEDTSGLKPFSLVQLQAAFYILPIGYIVALISLGLEVAFYDVQ